MIKNILAITVANTTGFWWYNEFDKQKENNSVLTRAAFLRALSHSLGSACVGGLLISVSRALARLNNYLRRKGIDLSLCLAECVLETFQYFVQYFHDWAFVYVGIRGCSFREAGENVTKLFQERGLLIITTENVVGKVLFMITLNVSLMSGMVGLVMASLNKNWFSNMDAKEGPVVAFL